MTYPLYGVVVDVLGLFAPKHSIVHVNPLLQFVELEEEVCVLLLMMPDLDCLVDVLVLILLHLVIVRSLKSKKLLLGLVRFIVRAERVDFWEVVSLLFK